MSATAITTSTVPTPPTTTAMTGPQSAAVSRIPKHRLVRDPIKTLFTAETARASHPAQQLYEGMPHHHADVVERASDREHEERERKRTREPEHPPSRRQPATAQSSVMPARSAAANARGGTPATAPKEGAARNQPSPAARYAGFVQRKSAGAQWRPPSSTAKRSSVRVARISFCGPQNGDPKTTLALGFRGPWPLTMPNRRDRDDE